MTVLRQADQLGQFSFVPQPNLGRHLVRGRLHFKHIDEAVREAFARAVGSRASFRRYEALNNVEAVGEQQAADHRQLAGTVVPHDGHTPTIRRQRSGVARLVVNADIALRDNLHGTLRAQLGQQFRVPPSLVSVENGLIRFERLFVNSVTVEPRSFAFPLTIGNRR